MRILHLTENYWPRIGGLETFLDNLASAQLRSGHEVSVLSNSLHATLPARDRRNGIDIFRSSFGQSLQGGNTAAVGRAVREAVELKRVARPDIIHVHADGLSPWLQVLTAEAMPVPSIASLHTPPEHMLLPRTILARFLGGCGRIAAVSDAMRRRWGAAYPEAGGRIGVVLNGIPLWPDPAPPPPAFERPVLYCLGRLDPTKGFDLALRAFAALAPRHPQAQLVIAGEGPARADLEALAAGLPGRERVRFRGWISPDAIPAALAEASIGLMPSRWHEPFGLVAVEFAQAGRPLVAGDVGGLPEIVVPGETGLLVPPDDPAALAGAVESLLLDPERARRLGANARRHARERFSLDRCAAEYERHYRELAGMIPTPA